MTGPLREAPDSGAPDDQREVIAFLSRPSSHGPHCREVRVITTHAAMVFLAGSEAYKIKRAVRYPYLDFSRLSHRRRACERELVVNQAVAPEIYLGLIVITREPDGSLAIGGPGEPVEWAVHMRRFDEGALLAGLLQNEPPSDRLIMMLAREVLHYHRAAPVIRGGTASDEIAHVLRQLETSLMAGAGVIAGERVGNWAGRCADLLARCRRLLDARGKAGCVRRCHGDLHLGNIVLIGNRPVLFDAIEFDERLATIDRLYDLAFLIMDLDRIAGRQASNLLLNRYLVESRSSFDLSGLIALPLLLSLRAAVRAVVAIDRGRHGPHLEQERCDAEARCCFDQAEAFLLPRPATLIAIGGLSGTGKTTLARAIAPSIGVPPGAIHIRSDVERKALFGVAETDRLPASAYTPAASARTYCRMLQHASRALRVGSAVVLDAVFARLEERAAASRLAKRYGVPFCGLWLELAESEATARVAARRDDASDATPDIVRRQFGYRIGPLDWHVVPAGGPPGRTLELAIHALARRVCVEPAQTATRQGAKWP